MADEQQIWLPIVVATIGVWGALIGYMYNSRWQRRLERNRIQYQAKLMAYRGLIDAAWSLMESYESLRGMIARIEKTRDSLGAALIVAQMAQDMERALGTSTSSAVLVELAGLQNQIVAHPNREKEIVNTADYKNTLAGAISGLTIVYSRVFMFQHQIFAAAYDNATLVTEQLGKVQKPVKELMDYLEPKFISLQSAFEKGLNGPHGREDSVEYALDEDLRGMWARVLTAIRNDLEETL